MPDIFTETSRETWAGSVLKSLVGLLFGAALVIGAVILLTWNEGRTIHRTRALEEIAVTVISVPSKKVSPSNEGKPVHVTGRADTKVILKDPLFGIACNALKLERHVEVFQWKEDAH
ncbi:MAG: hypothetical protein V4710_12420, partial [Verrucomicrobiota bacterium]